MALYIKDRQAEKLARDLARRTGESLTAVVRTALSERWNRLEPAAEDRRMRNDIAKLLRRVHALPIIDQRSEEEILGYGADGIPRGH